MKSSKKITIIAVLVLIAALACATGCGGSGDKELKAQFKSDISQAVAYLRQEFDVEPYIQKQSNVSYSLTAEYLDPVTFDPVSVDCNGLKVTPQLKENLFIKLIAVKGEQTVTSEEVEIAVDIIVDGVDKCILNTWKDDNFTKAINTDLQYIKPENGNSSLKIEWFGAEASNKDRWQYIATVIGDDITDYYTVTDWSDAVLEFWVYNPTDYDLEFSPIWNHNGANLTLDSDERLAMTAKANGWSLVKYSLRYYGITENWFYDADLYFSYMISPVQYGVGKNEGGVDLINTNWWTCRWAGRENAGKAYTYSFYLDEFNVRNYDSQKDSDLDHTLNGFSSAAGHINKVLLSALETTNDLLAIQATFTAEDTLTFEIKPVNDCTVRFCVITDDWDKYVGYFLVNAVNTENNSEGVSVEEIVDGDGWYTITVDLSKGTFMQGATSETIFKKLYFKGGSGDAYLDNFTIKNK